MKLSLNLLTGEYAVCQLPFDADSPAWADGDEFLAITRTADELSVVCESHFVPVGVKSDGGWRLLKVAGPLDFSLVGILANVAGILAEAGVSIFAISTYDTDYILIKNDRLQVAMRALRQAGHHI